MKIKPPKKPRKPSAKFIAAQNERRERESMTVPEDGDIRLYLDDERDCPDGWTLARTPAQFWNIVKGPHAARIKHMSLDWYLGHNVIADGVAIAEALADMMRTDEDALPGLRRIGLHSSDREKAMEMAQVLKPLIHDTDGMRFRIDIGEPNG